MSLDGVIYVVRLFEVQIEDIKIIENRKITWPKLLDEQKVHSVDGILVLYDVTNGKSVTEIPELLCKSRLVPVLNTARSSISGDAPTRCPTCCRFP